MGQVGAGPAQQDGGCFLACRVGPKLMKSCVRCISFRQAAGGGGRAAVAAAAAATAACPPAPPTPASALLVRGNHPHGSDCTHLPPAGSAARHAAPGRPCPAHPRLRRAAASRASLGAGGGRQPARCTGMGVDRDCLETIRSHCAGSFGIVSRYCPGLGVHSTCRELPTTCALPGMQLWRCRPTLPPCHNAPAPLRNQAIDRPVQPLHRRIELQVVGRGHKLREVEEQGGANRVLVQSDTDRLGSAGERMPKEKQGALAASARPSFHSDVPLAVAAVHLRIAEHLSTCATCLWNDHGCCAPLGEEAEGRLDGVCAATWVSGVGESRHVNQLSQACR